MLSRFCNSSLRIVRLAPIANTTNSFSIPILVRLQKSNYATAAAAAAAAPNATPSKSVGMNFILNDLKKRVENKSTLSKNDMDSLLHKLRTQKVDDIQALDILKYCAYPRVDSKGKNQINAIWEELKKQGIPFKIQHYKYLLHAYRDRKDVQRAQMAFDEMIKAGIKPDAIAYQCLLHTYCLVGDTEKATEILAMMDNDKLYINEVSFNNVVQGHIVCGNISAANDTVATLKESGFKLNYHTLEAFLQYYAKAGDLESIKSTFERFKEENVVLLSRDILRTIYELAANGHAEKIDSLMPYLKPSIEMRKSLNESITFFVKNGQSSIIPTLLKSSDGDVFKKYKLLIQEMVRFSTPEAEFKQTIEKIEAESGKSMEEMFDVFKPALDGPSEEIIRRLLAHMKSRQIPITETVFEQLFRLAAKKGEQEVLDGVKLMCSDYEIQPQITFIREVILPGLDGKKNPALALAKLQTTNLRARNILMAVATSSLNEGDMKTAKDILRANQSFYGIELVKRPLLTAFTKTGDVANFVPIVRCVYDSFHRINDYFRDKNYTDAEMYDAQKKFIENTLFAAISNRRKDTKLVADLLDAFIEEGLSIRPEAADKIQKLMNVTHETQIGRALKQLSAETLELKSIENTKPTNVMNQLKSADVQKLLDTKTANGLGAVGTEKMLFLAFVREGKITEVDKMLANRKFSLSNANYAALIQMYTRNRNVEKALKMLEEVRANDPSFKMDRIKVARLVALMVEKERSLADIDAILLAHRPDKAESNIIAIDKLLDGLASNGKPKMVESLLEAFTKYGYIQTTIETTAPMVTAYLKSGKFTEAVDKYEYLSTTHKVAPMTMVLFVQLIRNNQIDLLQRAYDTYEKIKGENKALCRLALAFVECGQERQARTIFENERTKNLSDVIKRECQQYVKFNRLESAKTLLTATQGLFCDRHAIYEALLDLYKKGNKAKEALDLWCEYSTEDGIIPKPTFKNKLTELLKANKMEIPHDLQSNQSETHTK